MALSLSAHALVLTPVSLLINSRELSFQKGKSSFRVSLSSQRQSNRPPKELSKKNPALHAKKATSSTIKPQSQMSGALETPQKLSLAPPAYPEASRLYGEEGEVFVSIYIGEDERAHKIRLISSSGYQRLDQAVIKKLEAMLFKGQEVGEVELSFKFELQ